MIGLFLDTILPGDKSLATPSGSQAIEEAFISQSGLLDLFDTYLPVLDRLSHEFFGAEFASLEAQERLETVEKSRRKAGRKANEVIMLALRGYYTSEAVLKVLPSGSVPPFPEGNFLPDDDWSILETVFERGPIYREVPE